MDRISGGAGDEYDTDAKRDRIKFNKKILKILLILSALQRDGEGHARLGPDIVHCRTTVHLD